MVRFHIRSARVADAAGIAEIHVAAWRAAYRGIMADEVLDGLDHERITANWVRNLGDDTSPMLSFVAVCVHPVTAVPERLFITSL